MSGSEGEAIIVNKGVVDIPPGSVGKETRSEEQSKMCSGCRVDQPLSQFWGTQRNEGREMRTCITCRSKQIRATLGYANPPASVGRIIPASPDEVGLAIYFFFPTYAAVGFCCLPASVAMLDTRRNPASQSAGVDILFYVYPS